MDIKEIDLMVDIQVKRRELLLEPWKIFLGSACENCEIQYNSG